jgi:hypothetical protein
MKARDAWLWMALLVSSVACAQEYPGCQEPDYDYTGHSASELRAIAASCKWSAMRQLYYRRAYHADLVVESRILSGLIPYSHRDVDVQFEAYRIYMGLIEALAPVWFPDPAERIAFLNGEYGRRSEVAELRLRGYDQLADRLERQTTVK